MSQGRFASPGFFAFTLASRVRPVRSGNLTNHSQSGWSNAARRCEVPKKDPMTGCEVMTLDEFAAAEGTTVSGLLEPMFYEFDKEAKEREEQIRRDPLAFFEAVFYACPPDEDAPPFVSGEVVKASVNYGFNHSREEATLRLTDSRGGMWLVTAIVARWDGSRWEPPDEETSVDWKEA
jgi:hypothetical protein